MPNTSWKSFEREASRALGGRRIPAAAHGGSVQPDVDHPQLFVECKLQRSLSLGAAWKETVRRCDIFNEANSARRYPCLVYRKKGTQGATARMWLDEIAPLVGFAPRPPAISTHSTLWVELPLPSLAALVRIGEAEP